MIALKELITSVRFKIKDPQGALYSDHEIAESINKAVKLLYSRMGENFIYVSIENILLTVEDGRAMLPLDFYAVKSVYTESGFKCHPTPEVVRCFDQFRITGKTFHALDGTYRFEYYKMPLPVYGGNDMVDIPGSIDTYLIEMATAMVNDDTVTAESVAQACCHALAGGDISHLCDIGPRDIWGGIA